MKIRTRITLWASLAGLVSTVVLSLIVVVWGLESPYEFLDQELEIRARTMANQMARAQLAGQEDGDRTLELFAELYWVRIFDERGRLLFASAQARAIELPQRTGRKGYLVRTEVPLSRFYAEEDDQPAGFWNRVFEIKAGAATYRVHVARPVENLVGESIESALMIGSALLASTLILVAVSYVVAGRILQPIREINRMTAEITASTLTKRIPSGGNRDEMESLINSLNAMFNRLQFSFRRQKEFVANASHELKTPVTLLRLAVDEMLQHQQLPLEFQEKLVAQEQALARISQLIKSLLDLSRLELSDSLLKEEFSLSRLCAAVGEEFELLLQEQGVRLSCTGGEELLFRGDREKMRRVLINLFDNGVRYNHPGGEINCTIEQLRTGGILLRVANTGPAIKPTDQMRIFDQFYRCEKSRSTLHGGAGLGLTIVRRIVELHGGTIAVESRADGWNIFLLEFPPPSWG